MEGIDILMYHQIGRFKPMKNHRATYCSINRFKQQMLYLHIFGYNVISMNEALDILSDKKPMPKKPVVLTFDDGYENFLTYAVPVLKKYNFPAIVYIIPSLIGKKAEWLEKDNLHPSNLMTQSQILKIRKMGFDIGSHNLIHEKMEKKSFELQTHYATESKRILEDILNEEIIHFCYPYGSHDINSLNAVEKAGYKTAVTCQKAKATNKFDLLALPRKAISFGDSIIGFIAKLHTKNTPKNPPIKR